ncbi:MAG: hypothetical protein C0516_07070 [Gemmatimonas sp.]|uniref:iron chaperone n=1 Tax=Gemmatimonas sp. UBA7669 TaxID=1946568 RepID=UPI0025BE0864|nr:DUF1801 domain-containing protein [Gemmatimonas sp. UBA7669]MBA3918330.1 hypothetical protein [Gemmatimonas sp.]
MHSPAIMPQNSLVDDYLAALPAPQREALSDLRTRLHALIPGADEAIKTRVPALRYKNKTVVGFGAGRTHLALYVMFGRALDTLADALQDYDATSRVVRYTIEHPLPDALIRKIVKLRLAEIDAQQKG